MAYDFCPSHEQQTARGISKWLIGIGTCFSVCGHAESMGRCSALHPGTVLPGDTPGDVWSAGEFLRNVTASYKVPLNSAKRTCSVTKSTEVSRNDSHVKGDQG